jgi:hypothetical protein
MTFPSFTSGEVLRAADMNAVGLWKVASGSLSGSTVNFQGCFSGNYNAYEIYITSLRAAANTEVGFRLLSGASAANTNNYQIQRMFGQSTSIGGSRATQTFGRVGYCGGTANLLSTFKMTIANPQVAKTTTTISQGNYADSTDYVSFEYNNTVHTLPNVYDGIQFLGISQNFVEGNVTIFGVRT